MAYNDMTGHIFHYVEDIVRHQNCGGNEGGGAAIGIGAHDFLISGKVLRKCKVTTISDSAVQRHGVHRKGKEFEESSKAMSKLFFRHYGYSTYVDLDIYDRADIVFDLSQPLPQDLQGKFDLVNDYTSNYVVNINQAYANTSRLVKLGGIKIVMAGLGDQTNRYDLNPSPNYLIDFHVNNGFRLEEAFLMDRKGRIVPYRRYQRKITPLPTLLPFRLSLMFTAKNILFSMYMRQVIKKSPYVDYGDTANYQKKTRTALASPQIAPSDNAFNPILICFLPTCRSGSFT